MSTGAVPGWAIVPVFQPIVRLDSGAVVAVEALSRFIGRGVLSAQTVFAQADATGVRTDLELLAIREALALIDELPADQRLSLNLSAPTLAHPLLPDALAPAPLERIILELTHSSSAPVKEVRSALDDWRAGGALVALDDVGSSTASMTSLVDLRPDYIKCDMALVRGIDADPARAAMVQAFAAYAAATGSEIIAEGIQSVREAAALQAVGVRLGQGFALGRPETIDVIRARTAMAVGQ